MGKETGIEWCSHTFNSWIGCTKIAVGCARCYAEADMDTRRGRVKWGPHGTRSRTSDSYWKQPLRWNREAEATGERKRVFCASLADVFEEWDGPIVDSKGQVLYRWPDGSYTSNVFSPATPSERLATMDDLRRDLFRLIDATPWLDWLLLTKRPERIRELWPPRVLVHNADGQGHDDMTNYRENVWLGCSISIQADADRNLPELLKCRDLAPVLFVSAEPLLEDIDFRQSFKDGSHRNYLDGQFYDLPCTGVGGYPDFTAKTVEPSLSRIHWVIVGGESGPHARPCDLAWVRSLVQQCKTAGTPAFVKQLGARPVEGLCMRFTDGPRTHLAEQVGQWLKLADSKGGNWFEWPADLRVRQFPEVAAHA
jgi:protein gp37